MFRVIRAGDDYDLLIAVTPANATPETEDAQYFRFATWSIGEHPADQFNAVSPEAAMGYFSGHADGLGHAELPSDSFDSLDAILAWRKTRLPIEREFWTAKATLSDVIFDIEDHMRGSSELRPLLRHRITRILFLDDHPKNAKGERRIFFSFAPTPAANASGDKLFLGW